MNFRSSLAGFVALATLGSCGKDGVDVASVLLVSSVEVTPSTGGLVLGGTAQLTATPKTASGITVPGRTVVWASSNPGEVSVSPTGVITALALGGPVRITATVDGVAGESMITVQPFPVARVTVTPDQAGIIVGGSSELTATAYDAQGVPLPDRFMIWQSSAPAIVAVTSTGIVLGMSEGGPVAISATAEGKSDTAFVSVAPRPAIRLSFVQQPGPATAGQPIAPAVRVAIQNDQGGTVSAAANPVSIALSTNPGGATLSGTTTVAALGGIATFPDLSLDRAAAGYTFIVTSAGLASATSFTFTNVAGPASRLVFTTPPPASAGSGQPLAPQPVLQLQDGSGNAVAQAGIVVTASIASGAATPGGSTTATTNSAGAAIFTTLSLSGPGGTITLNFSAPGITAATSAPITLSAGTATALAIVTQPSASAQSGVAFGVQPVVKLRDAAGNDVASPGVAITASIASAPAGATLGGGTTVQTSGSGVATFTNLAITGPAGSYTLQFSSPGLAGVTSTAIAVTAASASQLSITTQPSTSATSGKPFAQQPVLQLRDASGNAVGVSGVEVTAAIASGGGTLGGTVTVTTNSSGTASYTDLEITGLPGNRTLSFSSAGLTPAISSTISVGLAPATQLSVSTQPSPSAVSGAPFGIQPGIQLLDALGSPVGQSGVVVTATIASGGGTLGGTTTATTDNSGVATFTDLSISGAPGSRTLGFSAPGLTSATSNPISITAPSASKLTLTTQPSSSAFSGVAFGTQPVVQLLDASNNPVSQSGVQVTAAIASGGGTLGGTTTATTDAAGAATFIDLSISGTAGSRTLIFSSGTLTPVTSAAIDVAVTPAATRLGFATAPPATASSGVTFSVTPVIQLEDANGVAVSQSGVPVTVSVASGSATLSGTLTVNTGSTGNASFSGLSLTGTAGDHTLRFTSPGLTEIVSGTIVLGAGPATKLLIVTEPSSTATSGKEFSTQPVIRLLDASDNPVFQSGISITAALNSGIGTLGGHRNRSTNGSGIATYSDLKITGLGFYTIRFTSTGLAQVVSITITVTP